MPTFDMQYLNSTVEMQTRGVIIQGSSRSQGNTSRIVSYICEKTAFDVIDLNTKNIGYFDYKHANQDDDFLPLMRTIVDNYQLIVLVTPVYWYTMSAQMKTFLDRISDCLKIEKHTGRKLRNKYLAAISSSEHNDVPQHFFEPFRLSAEYLGMHYLGDEHAWIESSSIPIGVREGLDRFIQHVIKVLGTD